MTFARDPFGKLCLDGLAVRAVVDDASIGTPAYIYDLDAISNEARTLELAFDKTSHLVAYAVKANSAGPIVRALASQGCGADVVSGAEMQLALACGIAPERIVFSGVAKSDREIDSALSAGSVGICAIQVESVEEITRVQARAAACGRAGRVAFRINPGVKEETLGTHKHIATGHDEAKFGIAVPDVSRAIAAVASSANLTLVGMACHVGSQLTQIDPYIEAARILFDLARTARSNARVKLEFVDPGGGFGIDYGAGCSVKPSDFVRAVRIEQRKAQLDDLALHVEPGRALVAAHGVLAARVIQVKRSGERRWLMIDAGMNDLLRPALYQAHHRIVPLDGAREKNVPWRVVGPVCESSDDFGFHDLPDPPDAVAILDAGAYGYTMASRYNGRPLPSEVFVASGKVIAKIERRPIDEWVHERAEI